MMGVLCTPSDEVFDLILDLDRESDLKDVVALLDLVEEALGFSHQSCRLIKLL